MADVKVLSPLGTMYAVPEDQVQLAIERGYTVASEAELRRRALAKETQGEDVLAHASAAIDGALLNIPEAALSLTDWGKDKIKKWDQAFPEREATRLAGAVVPVIATLGLATPEVAAASGVRATAAAAKTAEQAYRFGKVGQIATAIPRMAATAGEAVAASSGLTGAARAGLSLGVAGGLENAIQETAAKTRELSVNDRLNGEGIAELFGATAKAGGVGLLFGGALGAGAEKLRASWAAKAADALEQVPEGTDPTWWGKFKASGYKKAFLARGATVEEAEQMANKVAADDAAFDIQNRMDELVRGKRMPVDRASDLEPSELDKIIAAHEKAAAEAERKADSELVGLAEEVARKAAASEEPAEAALRDLAKRPFNAGRQSVRDNVNELINDELVFRTVVANAARKESILLTEIPKTGLAGQEAAAEAVRLQARQLFDELSAGAAKDVGQYAPGPVRDFGNYIKGLERSLEAARQAPEEVRGVKFFTALDQFKRDVGRRIGRIAISDNAGIDTRNKISAFYSVPQRVLEDANFWGAAGTEQASRNVILSFIADRFGTFVGDITEAGTRRRNPVDPFGKGLPLASSKKIEQLFYEMAASPGDAKERTAREVIDALKRSTKRIVETGDFSEYPELLEVGKRNLARIDAIEKGLDSGAQMAREAIIKNTAPDGVLLDVAQAVSRTPGAPNVGGLFQSLSDPNTLRRGFRIVESLGIAREKRIGASVARAMRAMDDKAAPIANTAVDVPGAARATTAAGETVQLGEDLAAPLGGGATRGRVGASPLTRRIVPFAYQAYQAYTRNADRVRQLATNPQEVRSRLESDTKNIQGAPGAREAAIDTAMRRLQYLNDTLPKEVVPGTFFSSRIPPTKQEVNKWMNRWKATERPLSILDDLADGTLKPEMVEAVEAVYPETMAEIRSQIMAQLADMDSRNRRPPYADRIALGLMFGVQTVPEMDPDFLRLSQQIYAKQTPEQRQGGTAQPGNRAPNFASAYQSGADETATST